MNFVVHTDLKGSLPGFVTAILVKAQPATCKIIRDFFADPKKKKLVIDGSPLHRDHPDAHLRPVLYARGSFDRMMADRARLNQLAEEAHYAAHAEAIELAQAEAEAEGNRKRREEAETAAAAAAAAAAASAKQERCRPGAQKSDDEGGEKKDEGENESSSNMASTEASVLRKLLSVFQTHVPRTNTAFRSAFAGVLAELQEVLEDQTVEFEQHTEQMAAAYEERLQQAIAKKKAAEAKAANLAVALHELRAAVAVGASSQFFVKPDGIIHSYDLQDGSITPVVPEQKRNRNRDRQQIRERQRKKAQSVSVTSTPLRFANGNTEGARSQSAQVTRTFLEKMALERVGKVLLGSGGFTPADAKAVRHGAGIGPRTAHVDHETVPAGGAQPPAGLAKLEEFYKGVLTNAARNHDAQVEKLVECISRERSAKCHLERQLQELRGQVGSGK